MIDYILNMFLPQLCYENENFHSINILFYDCVV